MPRVWRRASTELLLMVSGGWKKGAQRERNRYDRLARILHRAVRSSAGPRRGAALASAGKTPRQVLALPARAWLAGLALLQQCPRLPDATEWTVLLLALLAATGLAVWRRRGLWFAVAALLLAFAQGGWRAQLRLDDALPEAWEKRDLWLSPPITSLPAAVQGLAGAPGWRFEVEREQG